MEAALAQWRGALPTLRALQLPPKWLSKQASVRVHVCVCGGGALCADSILDNITEDIPLCRSWKVESKAGGRAAGLSAPPTAPSSLIQPVQHSTVQCSTGSTAQRNAAQTKPHSPRCLQAWLWAASTLSSRTMYVPYDPAGALTPFGDLHNYAPPPPPLTPCLRQRQRAEHGQQESALPAVAARQAVEQQAAGGGPGQVAGVRISQPLASFQQRQPQGRPHLQQECAAGGGTCGSGGSLAAPSTAVDLTSSAAAAAAGQGTTLAPAERASANGGEVPRQLAGDGPAADCGFSAASSSSGATGSDQTGNRGNGGVALGGSNIKGSGSARVDSDSVGAESELCGDGSLDVAAAEYCIFVRRRWAAGCAVRLLHLRQRELSGCASRGCRTEHDAVGCSGAVRLQHTGCSKASGAHGSQGFYISTPGRRSKMKQ